MNLLPISSGDDVAIGGQNIDTMYGGKQSVCLFVCLFGSPVSHLGRRIRDNREEDEK